jgi:hypothetical protein
VDIHVCALGWRSCMCVRVDVHVCVRVGVHMFVRVGIHVCYGGRSCIC